MFQQQNALFALVAGHPGGGRRRRRSAPSEAADSTSVWNRDSAAAGVRARVGYFNNDFDDLLEYLSKTALVLAGVPPAVAAATPFGAYVNSQSYNAQGAESSFDAAVGNVLRFSASYTYLDAEVTEAFSATAAFNPSFPNVPIGAFSPLVGARPSVVPPNSGTLFVSYANGPAQVALSGYFSGRRDDSTFLSDEFFGNSMLLPNKISTRRIRRSISASRIACTRGCVSTRPSRTCSTRITTPRSASRRCPFTIRGGAAVTLGGDR